MEGIQRMSQFYEESETLYRLSIREFHDQESATGKAWIIDLLSPDGSELIIDSAGVASTLALAMEEAGKAIAVSLSEDWQVVVK